MNATALLEAMNITAPTLTGVTRIHLCSDSPVKAPDIDAQVAARLRAKMDNEKYRLRMTQEDAIALRRALSQKRRDDILFYLKTIQPATVSVNQLRAMFPHDRSTISADLKQLRQQGLVAWSGTVPYFYWAA